MSAPPPPVAALARIVAQWETAEPSETISDGDGLLLDALAPLIAPVDVRPLGAALTAGDGRARGAVGELRRLAPDALTALLDWIQELAGGGGGPVVLQRLPVIEKLALAVGESGALARAEYLRGYTLRRQDDEPGAIAAYRRALQLAPAGDAEFRSRTYDRLGNLQRETGDYDGAIESYASALAVETDPANRATILRNSALAFRDLGERGEADRREKEAGELVAGSEPDGFALDRAAQALAAAGDFDRALELNAGAASYFVHGYPRARAVNAYLCSRFLLEAGRAEAAASQFRTALGLFRLEAEVSVDETHYTKGFDAAWQARVPDDHRARQTFNAALALRSRGQFAQAISALGESARLARDAGDEALALRAEALGGGWCFDVGDFRQSKAALATVQAEGLRLGLALPEMSALVTLASMSQSGSDTQQDALASLARASRLRDIMAAILARRPMSDMQRLIELNDTGAIENQFAKFTTDMGLWQEAADFSEKAAAKAEVVGDLTSLANRLAGLRWAAIKGGDTARGEAAAGRLRTLLEGGKVPPRGRIVAARSLADHVRHQDPAESLHWLEEAVAAAEEIRAAVPIGQRDGLDRQWSDLFWRLPEALRAAGRVPDAFDALQLGKARDLAEAASVRVGGNGAPPRLPDVQAMLGPNDVLLDITNEREALVGYLVNAQGLTTVSVPGEGEPLTAPDRGDLRERAASMLNLTRQSELLTKFAAEVEAALPADARLLIVPEPRLSNLALHAIPVGGQPWCELRRMGQLPSAGVLRAPRSPRTGRAFVAGNSRRDLPGAEAECHAVGDLYGVAAHTGPACTVAALRDALASGRLDAVHLATHGRGNPRRGGQASLMMADGAGGTHWVDMDELTRLQWNVGLVVLAGCSTGLAGPKDGFELVSVAGQILGAGAGAVVACLWPVGDAATQLAMLAFHRALRPGAEQDVRAALDAARAALRDPAAPVTGLRDGRNVSPEGPRLLAPEVERDLNWSAFVAFGAPDPFS